MPKMKQIVTGVEQKPSDILVVDDTPANLQLLTAMLKERGYRVRPVPSGKLAIQAVKKEKPDLILLDINMPDMNGYEVCEQLKADAELKDIPILFISALDKTMGKIKAFAAGGVDYVTKPFQFEEVEARVETHLKLSRLQTELERQNRRLQENFNQLKKLEDLRDNLTNMIVHDLRSPLAAIIGHLELLKLGYLETLKEKSQESVETAFGISYQLLEMINSLLDVARIENGQMPLRMEPCDLQYLAHEAIAILGPVLGGATVSVDVPSDLPRVACDGLVIQRVMINLLGNAAAFMPVGGHIRISIVPNEDDLKISVTDTGPGIPVEYHEKIFEKFGRVEPQLGRRKYSTGLGLTFCKLAVETHGGRIGVESQVGHGSTFWFSLPTCKYEIETEKQNR